ncbi:MAG: hypothetical protein ACI33J_08120 [Clostridium sp.]
MNEVGRILFGVVGICYLILATYSNFKRWCDSKDISDFMLGLFLTLMSGAGLIYIANTL